MFNLIIASSDKNKREDYIGKYCKKLAIDPLDVTVIRRETALKLNVNSLGIEEVKNMQKKLFLKPIKSKTKAVVVEDAELLTTEAQNAMLKLLEEPPDNTIVVLSADTKEAFLPTIISRCKVIELEGEKRVISEKEMGEIRDVIERLPGMSIGEKMKLAEDAGKDKEKALAWIAGMIIAERDLMLKKIGVKPPDALSGVQKLKALQRSYLLLKTTNASARMIIEVNLLGIK